MVETLYEFSLKEATVVEQIVKEYGVRINHLSLAEGEKVDPHPTPDTAHMIVTQGTLAIKLNDQERKNYSAGTIIGIPANTMLDIVNGGKGVMHLFVIKKD
ncbi:MAG: cupin domain-containing protein [Sphaerochaetaceae bacterium]|jgi:quercetin dioxygenase-like cupin family protein